MASRGRVQGRPLNWLEAKVIEPVTIGKRGIKFKIWKKWKKKDKLSGTLIVSVGGLSWYPAKGRTRRFIKWEDFANAMEADD